MDNDLYNLMLTMDDTPVVRERGCKRAPFGYPGGKRASAEFIHPHLPYRAKYGEPFGGSGTILLQRSPVNLEVFNDRYSGITCFYRVLRCPKKRVELTDRLALITHSREEFEWCHKTWEKCEDEVERAARWWYMHQASFTKKENAFGRSTSGKNQTGQALRNNLQWFEPTHQRLANVVIENLDWRVLLKDYDGEGMVWYMDPPYVKYAKGLYYHEFKKQDHVELCERIFRLKGFVALSGYGDDETKNIYDRYNWDRVEEWSIARPMSCYAFSDTNNMAGKEHLVGKGSVKENLWIKEGD